jgi:hypothetical protein
MSSILLKKKKDMSSIFNQSYLKPLNACRHTMRVETNFSNQDYYNKIKVFSCDLIITLTHLVIQPII